MFLISKIVRGRRLLQELEAENEKKAVQETTAAEPSVTVLRQNILASRTEKSMGEMSQVCNSLLDSHFGINTSAMLWN